MDNKFQPGHAMSASVFRHLCGVTLLKNYKYFHDGNRREFYYLRDRELWDKGKMFREAIAPQFFMSNGSEARVPHVYQQAVFKMTEAVTCTKCKHQHLLEPPSLEMSVADLESVQVSAAVA